VFGDSFGFVNVIAAWIAAYFACQVFKIERKRNIDEEERLDYRELSFLFQEMSSRTDRHRHDLERVSAVTLQFSERCWWGGESL
jgi:hypothetical protein